MNDKRGDTKITGKWTSEDCLKEMEKLFSSSYLTMLSIIQGVSFSFIMFNIVDFWANRYTNGNWVFLLYSALSILVLTSIWLEYLHSLQFPRILNVEDTFWPILLGVSQILAAYNIGNPKGWLFCLLFVHVFGYFAYRNTRKSVYRMPFEEKLLKIFNEMLDKKEYCMKISAINTFVFLVLQFALPGNYHLKYLNIGILDMLYFLFAVNIIYVIFCMSSRHMVKMKGLGAGSAEDTPSPCRFDIFRIDSHIPKAVKRKKNKSSFKSDQEKNESNNN